MVWRIFNFVILSPIKKIFVKEVIGINNIPNKPPFLIVSNHASVLDPFIIGKLIYDKFKRKIHYVANPGRIKSHLIRKILKIYIGYIPTTLPPNLFYNTIKKTLDNCEIVGIFPEGYYTPDGSIKSFKIGVGRMALESSVQILPVALQGTYDICPGPKLIPKFKKAVKVAIGKPITFNKHRNTKTLKTAYKIINIY